MMQGNMLSFPADLQHWCVRMLPTATPLESWLSAVSGLRPSIMSAIELSASVILLSRVLCLCNASALHQVGILLEQLSQAGPWVACWGLS